MLKNKIAVITGGARGIGKAIALKMAEQGADIAIIYKGSEEAAQEALTTLREFGVKANAYKCDISNFEESKAIINEIVKDFETIDILVNNAGITRDNLIMMMKPEDFDTVIDTNLKGTFNMIKHVTPLMMKKKKGKIINISSVSGMMGNPGQANYSAAKAGVIGLTKTVAKEFSSRNITCNAIAPGFIETDMTAKLSDEVKNEATKVIPLKRMGKPGDIGNAAVFLASHMADYITGEVLKVDGGLYV